MDHDALFKLSLRTFFIEFIYLFLPEVAAYLDPGSVEFLDKEVFTDVTGQDRREVDLVVKVRFRGQEAFFLIHIELQSSAQERFPRRMFSYFARLLEQYDLPIYPIVLFTYDAPLRPEPDRFQIAFPDRTVLDFTYRVIQLNRLNWRDYVRQPNPVAAALMSKMRIAPEDRPRVKLECLRLIVTLRLDPARQALIRKFLNSYLRLSDREMEVYNREIATIDEPEQEAVMEIVSEWEELGMQKRGTSIVLRQLRHKFGPVSADLEKRISDLQDPKSEDLAEALLDFSSLSEAQTWLDQHG